MKKRFLLLLLALCLMGCSSGGKTDGDTTLTETDNQEIKKEEPMEITAFSFSHSGMSMDQCYSYTVTKEGDGVRFQAELSAGNTEVDVIIDEPVLAQLSEIADTYEIKKWDGFHKTNSMVLDGDGFGLSVTYADGSSISAGGSNSFPKGYGEAAGEITSLFDGLVKEYGNLYPKTLSSDELDFVMISLSLSVTKKCSVMAYHASDGRVKISINISGYEEFDLEENYAFTGYCDTFPFEEIQAVIRKYDVPTWNGWDKTAENYSECEWFQIEFGYASDESISAMGTLYPENYEEARQEILSILNRFICEKRTEFTTE
ncbi:MAG: hypothetical protein ACI4ER_06575 [Suilimivivens sp.]